jgi:cytochrome P450
MFDHLFQGFFHNATPKIVPDSIFSVDTGPEWQLRRNAFRKAFSNMSLRAHTPSITKLNEKLCRFMEEKAKSGEIFAIDDAFTELTIGVICEVAFEMDAKAFDHTSGYCQRIDEVTKYLFEV